MAQKESQAQAAEAAAIRRRWITLGEVLAVVAVAISGLTLWNSYSERTSSEAEKAAAKRAEAADAQTLILRAAAADGGSQLNLTPLDGKQAVQSQTIAFPSALQVPSIDTVIEPRLEADWLEKAIVNARRATGKAKGEGDERLPVLITTRFFSDGESHQDVSIYDVGYKVDSGFLQGTDIELRGLSHVERARASSAQARLDRLWKERQPTISSSEKK